ncbi:Lar family restriction alleviation protein [Yersinia enterocolitica]|uniref:Lar family restriction alleviation protein n=1 Tax=Yersinia enterocolitica TaxID=630 RepID=UPI00313BA830
MNNIEELKPCPFCGGKAHLLTSNGSFLVECSVCLTDFLNGPVGIGWYRSEKDAAASWNDRPSERALIAQLEAAQKERDEFRLAFQQNEQAKQELFAQKDLLITANLNISRRAEKAEAALSAANEKPKPISFDELADRVQFVTGGIRMSFDPLNCKGHQIVPFMNFNSLLRIVEMYRTTETYHLAGFTVEGE